MVLKTMKNSTHPIMKSETKDEGNIKLRLITAIRIPTAVPKTGVILSTRLGVHESSPAERPFGAERRCNVRRQVNRHRP
jgi:hypothetical protein